MVLWLDGGKPEYKAHFSRCKPNLIPDVQSSAYHLCGSPSTFLTRDGFSWQFNIHDGDVFNLLCAF